MLVVHGKSMKRGDKDTGVQVINDPTIADAPITSKNFVSVLRSKTLWGDTTASDWDVKRAGGMLKLDLDLYIHSRTTRNIIFLNSGPVWDGPCLDFYGDGSIMYSVGTSTIADTGFTGAVDSWQHITLLIDVPNNT